MSFDHPEHAMEEVKAAIDFRNRHTKTLDEQVRRFRGPYYQKDTYSISSDYSPENTYYEYVSLMIPKLIFDNPRVQVQTRRPGAQKDVATALRHGLNRWARDFGLQLSLQCSHE